MLGYKRSPSGALTPVKIRRECILGPEPEEPPALGQLFTGRPRSGCVSAGREASSCFSSETLPLTVRRRTSRDDVPICPCSLCLLRSPSVLIGKSVRIIPLIVLSSTLPSRLAGSLAVM